MTEKISLNIDGICTASLEEEIDCKFFEPGLLNGGKCLMRSIIENHCCSFPAAKERYEMIR